MAIVPLVCYNNKLIMTNKLIKLITVKTRQK